MYLLLLICLFVGQLAHVSAKEEEIYVQLSHEVEMMPLFVTPITRSESTLADDYLKSVRDVLLFDLNHNGMTRVITPKEVQHLSSLKDQNNYDADLNFDKLKADGLLYLIKLKIKGTSLFARIISVNSQAGNTIDNITLCGDLGKDRLKMHQLADTIHKLLFGKPGIATCRILYTNKRKIERGELEPTWVSEVFVSDYDGHNARQLTRDNALTANPLFIPAKGNHFVDSFLYVSYKIGQPKIYMASLSAGEVQRVSSLRSNQVTPAVNKTGSLLAFACDVTGRADIFMQPMPAGDGELPLARQIFTAKGVANASPTFSPDSKRIAFVSDKDGSPKVYVMDIPSQGTKLADVKTRLISKRCRENSAPNWSPDGKKLAYCSKTGGERQIWIYDFETDTERQLTQGKANKENPFWASDSLHLLFNATDSSGTEIYLVNLNQPNAVRITTGTGAKYFPSWEPKNLQ